MLITCPLCKINVAEEINKNCRNGITRSQYAAVGQYVWNNCSSRRRKTNKDEPIKVFATSPAIHRVHYGPQMDNNAVQIIVNLLKYHQRTNFKNNMTNSKEVEFSDAISKGVMLYLFNIDNEAPLSNNMEDIS